MITGAEWLEKKMERIHLNLKTGESDPLPDGIPLDHMEQMMPTEMNTGANPG